MPWKPSQAKSHTKAASAPAKQKQWASTANAARQKTGSDASAIRIANAAVKGGGKKR